MTEQKPLTIDEYKRELEETLDQYFPKIHEEGAAKIANKRSQALMLYTQAVLLAPRLQMEVRTVDICQRDAQKVGKQLCYVAAGDRLTTTDPDGKQVVFNIRPNAKSL